MGESPSISRQEAAAKGYLLLIGVAERKDTISYQQFADRLGHYSQPVNSTLRLIHRFCDSRGLPLITALVLSRAGMPGDEHPIAGNPQHYRERVLAED